METDVRIQCAHPEISGCFRLNQKCGDMRACSISQRPVSKSNAALVAADNVSSKTWHLALKNAPKPFCYPKLPTITNLRRKDRYPMH